MDQLLYTLWINVVVFASLMACFELNRHVKSIYLQRTQHPKYTKTERVPPIPPSYPFAWIVASLAVTEDQILEMVGLDGYMLIRYIHVCWRICAFITFFGLIVLVPIYATAGQNLYWATYTIANIPEDTERENLYWAPCLFAYVFSYYFCKLFKEEYEHFLEKKVRYLVTGDVDTHPQTYLTVMVEKIPATLRSREELGNFFNNLFPGKVYCAEFALDVQDLDKVANDRRVTRNRLEKAIAIYSATGRRPVVWLPRSFYDAFPNSHITPLAPSTGLRRLLRQQQYDSIDHYHFYLNHLNSEVEQMQASYMNRDQREGSVDAQMTYVDSLGRAFSKVTEGLKRHVSGTVLSEGLLPEADGQEASARRALEELDADYSPLHEPSEKSPTASSVLSKSGNAVKALGKTATAVGSSIGVGLGTFAWHGIDNFMSTAEGAFTGLRQAGKTIELLTVGAHYKTSSTAFVTFNSRVAMTSAHQMLMSHEYSSLIVTPAPNPKEIIWTNVAVPLQQINTRRAVANVMLTIGIVYWGAVVAFIATITNLESLSKQSRWSWLTKYKTNYFYTLLNNYLALGLLLILLSLLPVLFQLSLRSYERCKLESDVQNLIMTRYYFFQVANVYVSVGFGSITSSISAILADPSNILRILGYYIASFSTYFAQLVIIKTFTGLPIELMRLWPLIQIFFVKMCTDKKKCTRRELRSGVLYNPEMLYGWVYPNCLMVLMIMCIYCCIAPLIMPIVLMFFSFIYVIYRYQLLFVFINSYQSGGYMWYSVFSRSMFALTAGMTTFCCYLGIRVTFGSGPFYAILPLPIILVMFSQHCERKYKQQSINLSMQQAMAIDKEEAVRMHAGETSEVASTISPTTFRQPNLSEGRLRPAVYRRARNSVGTSSFDNPELEQGKSTEFVQRFTTDRADASFYEYEEESDAGDEQAKELDVDNILADSPDDTRSSTRTRESAASSFF